MILDKEEIVLGLKRTTKDFLEEIVENLMESFVVTDIEGTIVFFNRGSEKLFLYSQADVLGKHITILGARRPNVMGIVREGKIFKGEIFLMRKNGERFPAYVICVPLKSEKGLPMGMVGAARDLTEEKKREEMERQVSYLKNFYENLISSLNEGIAVTDHDGKIFYINKRFEDMTGYLKQEILGQKYEVFFGKYSANHRTKNGNESEKSVFEAVLQTKDNRRIPVLVSSSAMKDFCPWNQPETQGFINVFTDIKEVNALREELFRLEKITLLGKLAGEIAHEMNNPLSGILLVTQMLLEALESRKRLGSSRLILDLKEIEKNAERCRRFISKLLNLSRSFPEQKTLLNVSTVVRSALSLLERKAARENIEIQEELDDRLSVYGDSHSLEQVVLNLMTNAIEAIESSKGSIIIRTYEKVQGEKSWACLEINDTGRGISEDIMGKIFDPFFTTKPAGTGLGLSISKRIVEDHGGKIFARNLEKEGASFLVLLPLVRDSISEGKNRHDST